MAHLDTEFKQQQNPELKSLISDQVKGLPVGTSLYDSPPISLKESKCIIPCAKIATGGPNVILTFLR